MLSFESILCTILLQSASEEKMHASARSLFLRVNMDSPQVSGLISASGARGDAILYFKCSK